MTEYGAEGAAAASSDGPSATEKVTELPSIEILRERILRKIMRIACGVGLVGLVLGAVLVRPLDVPALVVSAIATALVYGVTLLPERRVVLSSLYPWALVLVGCVFAWIGGPRTNPFLMMAGGIFIGSLTLRGRELTALVTVLFVSCVGVVLFSGKEWTPELRSIWVSGATTTLAVVAPAASAGRILVSVLARAIEERETLLSRLREESRQREATLRTLEATRTQLTHAQKMELIGQMAGGIAHDMNNALTSVMGEASMLGDAVAEERDRIVEAAVYAAKLTQQLMVFSRRDVSQPRPLDLIANIRASIRPIRRMVPSEIEITTHLPEEQVAIVADPTQILQILLNLAGNAKDAMGDAGRLSIRLLVEKAAKQATIEVADTGGGIPPETLPRIFEPFFTTKPAGMGTGLGLANVRQIVESMGGTIDVASVVGQGTCFTLRVPLTELAVAAEPGRTGQRSGRGGTVLVVDDDVRVRAVVFTALERLGYRVLEAASPDAAVAVAKAEPSRIDLLLTDVVMPGGGGRSVIARLQEIYPDLRVLVTSGYTDDETLRRGIAQGTYPFLAKPFTIDGLANAVDAALA